jgi:hypothetical protein
MYFVEIKAGKKLGFPRLQKSSKLFIWKRMNFETDLPKSYPLATYIVASSNKGSQKETMVSCHFERYGEELERINSSYRMHIVWEYNRSWKNVEKNETEFPDETPYFVLV